MKMHLRVKYDDGSTADAVVSAVDLVAFESKFDKSIAQFSQTLRMTDIYWLAWHTLHRSDKSLGTFEEWLENKDPEVVFGDEDEIVPLENNQQPGT